MITLLALFLKGGPLAPTRMDQGRRCRRIPPRVQGYGVRLHQGAEAGGAATEAARDHLCVYCKYSQAAADAGDIIEP